MDRMEAKAALEDVSAAERRLAEVGAPYPLWRHAAFGAVMGGLVMSQGLAMPWGTLLFVAAMGSVAWLTIDDRRRYGVFVSGYRMGKTLPLTLALLVATVGGMFLMIRARTAGEGLDVRAAIAGAVFLVAFGASLWWTRIYTRELQEGRR